MATESDQPQEDLERSTEVVVEYAPETVGRVRKVTTWVAGTAIDASATTLQYSGKAVQFAGKGVQAAGTGISAVGTGISSTLGAIPYVGIPFRVLGQGINGVGKGVNFLGKGIEGLGKGIESAGNGLKKAKQGFGKVGGLLKSGGKVTQMAKVAGGPVGIALMIANNPWVKRIAKGIGALLAYLLLLFGYKAIGAGVGLVFGMLNPITFGPLGAPGWAMYGWNHPAEMTHLGTHPWEFFTDPKYIKGWAEGEYQVLDKLSGGNLSKAVNFVKTTAADGWGYVKGAYNAVTGGPIGVGGGIVNFGAGVVSTVGSAITAAAASIWGGITSAGGAIFGGLASGLNFVVGSLTSTGIPTGVVAVATGGTMLTITTYGILNDVNKNVAFSSNQQDAVIGGTGDNEIYTISKTVSDRQLNNEDLPKEITFTIKLTAKADLTNISVVDKIEVRRKDGIGFTVSRDTESKLINPPCGGIEQLTAGSDWTCEFTIAAESLNNFKDSVITNTVTITAGQAGSAPITDTAFSVTTIGSPPVGCPNDWPTDHGYITNGPEGSEIHKIESSQGWPAIDIGQPLGTPTYTTFAGRVKSVVNDEDGGGFGVHVIIEANCDGKQFEALWSHMVLDSIDPAIKVGMEVGVHQLIGEIDHTGISEGDHLHYAFNGLEMKEPYIPKNPKSEDCTSQETCNVEW